MVAVELCVTTGSYLSVRLGDCCAFPEAPTGSSVPSLRPPALCPPFAPPSVASPWRSAESAPSIVPAAPHDNFRCPSPTRHVRPRRPPAVAPPPAHPTGCTAPRRYGRPQEQAVWRHQRHLHGWSWPGGDQAQRLARRDADAQERLRDARGQPQKVGRLRHRWPTACTALLTRRRRDDVIRHLQTVVEEFVRRVCRQKGVKQAAIDVAGGKVFTFGSYALGVHGPTSDIDSLVVVPKQVSIDDFFRNFPAIFREMSKTEDITELNPVEDAFVPIIKMEYRGVSIDLIFASLPKLSSIPRDMDTIEKKNLDGLAEQAMRSVNGTRVTKELLAAVPHPGSFRHALRAIKLWSNERGIYGAVFGYPGGVAWAIMVARICQLYPFANGATIVSKFFSLMQKWSWPRPVLLKHIEEGAMGLRVWNPQVRLSKARRRRRAC